MSGILAVVHLDGAPVERAVVEHILAASRHRGPDGQEVWLGDGVALAHQHFWLTPEEVGERQPLFDGPAQCALVCDARLDNRTELLASLGDWIQQDRSPTDAQLILWAYRKWGTACVERLLGDFAVAIWDRRQRQLFVTRDPLGVRDLCYCVQGRLVLVASEIDQLLAHPAVQPRLNEESVADMLAVVGEEHEATFYQGICFLPPAHCLAITANGVRKWRYWDVNPEQRIRYRSDQDYAEHYSVLLAGAIRCRLRTIGPVGVSLSGGLDSTALAALTAALLPQSGLDQPQLCSFSYVFDELVSCDERRYIEPVVKRSEIAATYIPCDDRWTLRNLEAWPVERATVLRDPYAWLPEAVMEAAEAAGCRVLLAGYYGDVLFTGGAYWALDMVREGRLGALARLLWDHRGAVRWQRDMLDCGLRPLIPRRAARAYRRLRPRPAAPQNPALHPDFVRRTRLVERIEARQRWNDFPRPGQWPRYRSLMHGWFAAGVAATRKAYNRHGLELVMPYWDRRLVEFMMALPADQLARPGWDRWLHRQALKGWLPEAVLARRERTSFLPLFQRGMERERAAVEALMTEPQIVARSMIRPDYLAAALADGTLTRRTEHWFWLCCCLELWLRRHW